MVTSITTDSVSKAWYQAVASALDSRGHKLFHLVVNISSPLDEEDEIRRAVDALLDEQNLQPVETVANTLMPVHLAEQCADHDELVSRYRRHYDRIKKFPKNSWGTYFGRLVAYPIGNGNRPAPVDQLGPIINDLRSSRVVAAQYETAVATANDDRHNDQACGGALIHHPTRGRHGRGGPCLSHVAFQREGEVVHAVAHYRSQYLIERAYGNYLGLGRLLSYIAHHANLQVGELTVVAGYATLDQPIYAIERVLADLENCVRN